MKENKFINFLNLFSSEKLLLDEINKLKKFFKIDEGNEEMNEYLRYNFKREFTKKVVFSYIKTIKRLNLCPNIFDKIDNIMNRLLELDNSKSIIEKETIQINFSILNQIFLILN